MGSNQYGQLGLGTLQDHSSPQLLASPNAQPISGAALGQRHSAFITGVVLSEAVLPEKYGIHAHCQHTMLIQPSYNPHASLIQPLCSHTAAAMPT